MESSKLQWINQRLLDMVLHKQNTAFEDLPLYKHVSLLLNAEITKQFKPGEMLPSETELARRFKVNRHTLRRALEVLVSEGVVAKIQGRGTIVQHRLINYSIHDTSRFTETLEKQGRVAEIMVLRKEGIPATGEVAELLQLEEDEPVALLETLRKMDDIPFSCVTHYLPLEKVYDVIRLYNGGSLHKFIYQRYNIEVICSLCMIRAVVPGPEDVKNLSILGDGSILLVKSVNVDRKTGLPMELSVSRFKGTATQLIVEPNRLAGQ